MRVRVAFWLFAGLGVSVVLTLLVLSALDTSWGFEFTIALFSAALGAGVAAREWSRARTSTEEQPSVPIQRRLDPDNISRMDIEILNEKSRTEAPTRAEEVDRLLANMVLIERLAAKKTADHLGKGQRYPTLFQLRSQLKERGIWKDSDVKAFDQALRIRNAIVHGDNYPGETRVKKSVRDTEHLISTLGGFKPRAQWGPK
jgi:hypothetical protein